MGAANRKHIKGICEMAMSAVGYMLILWKDEISLKFDNFFLLEKLWYRNWDHYVIILILLFIFKPTQPTPYLIFSYLGKSDAVCRAVVAKICINWRNVAICEATGVRLW